MQSKAPVTSKARIPVKLEDTESMGRFKKTLNNKVHDISISRLKIPVLRSEAVSLNKRCLN